MDRKQLLLMGGAASALGAIGTGVQAQEARQLDEIIVTAQRREESLLDTPLTVTAIGGNTIEEQNVRTLEGLTALVPGLEIEPDGGRTAIRLRGIATQDGAPGAENIAALHVDNVYISHRTSLAGYFYDVERVEVLQGPQGTLYGRNTAAGTMNIISRRPNQEAEGAVELDAGTYDSRRLFGMLNVPVSDNLALRGAFQASSRDGYFDSNVDETNDEYGRVSIQWDPSDNVSWYSKLDFGRTERRGNGVAIFGSVDETDPDNWVATIYDDDTWLDDTLIAHPADPAALGVADNVNFGSFRTNQWGVMTELTVALGDNAEFIANLGRIEEEYLAYPVDLDGEFGTPTGAVLGGTPDNQVLGTPWVESVYDLRFQGTAADSLDWTVGLFYWEDDTNEPAPPNPNGGISFHAAQSLADSDAIYGQVTWTPRSNENFHLTVGGRKTNDWKQWDFQVLLNLTFPGAPPPFVVGGSNGVLTQEWDHTDYKVGVAFDLENGLVYANASSGYRAGSWFPGPLPYYNPEFVDAFELGWKGRVADDRLELNANAYVYDYTDAAIQFDSFNLISQESEIGYGNLGNADVTGFNFSGTWLAGDSDQVTFNFDYTDAEITSFDFASVLTQFPVDQNGNPIYSADDVFDWTGLSLPNTIPYRLTLAWNHDFNTSGGAWSSRLQTVWADSRFSGYRTDTLVQYEFPAFEIGSYTTLDWNINYTPSAGDWNVGFYALNITDERIPLNVGTTGLTGTLAVTPPPNGDTLYLTGRLRPPRTIGFRVGYRF